MLTRERLRLAEALPPAPEADWSIRGSLVQLFKKLDERQCPLLQQVQARWPAIAGPQFAAHAWPGRLNANVLYVYVDSSAWLNEIVRFQADNILRQIRSMTGPADIKTVRYQVNPRQARKVSG